MSHERGSILRLDQLPFSRKPRELEILEVSPAFPLDRDPKALHQADDRTTRAPSSEAKPSVIVRSSAKVDEVLEAHAPYHRFRNRRVLV
jgi:hypothetical protein